MVARTKQTTGMDALRAVLMEALPISSAPAPVPGVASPHGTNELAGWFLGRSVRECESRNQTSDNGSRASNFASTLRRVRAVRAALSSM